ncbi:MAG: 16S rRNA (guanine(527)-N(7))-methyltransferase RsmG [Anaerolineales bacterium]|jgi:16S rRNA (guanine527-N7)-methyltransferase
MEDIKRLRDEAAALLDILLSDQQIAAFLCYADELAAWNRKMNLTAIVDPVDIRRKHFLDSLSCHLAMADATKADVVDVGAGAGFPGIPLKLFYPEMNLTVIESVKKKTWFISHMVAVLKLQGVEALTARAEKLGQDSTHRERYDWAVARAVASLPVLVEYLLPLVRVGGYALAQKGEGAMSEVEEAYDAIDILGGKVAEIIPVEIPGVDERRHLVVIEKISPTPEKYPRRVGVPTKRPLG